MGSFSAYMKRALPKILIALTGSMPLSATEYPKLSPPPKTIQEDTSENPSKKAKIQKRLDETERECIALNEFSTGRAAVVCSTVGCTARPKGQFTRFYPQDEAVLGQLYPPASEIAQVEEKSEPQGDLPKDFIRSFPLTPETWTPKKEAPPEPAPEKKKEEEPQSFELPVLHQKVDKPLFEKKEPLQTDQEIVPPPQEPQAPIIEEPLHTPEQQRQEEIIDETRGYLINFSNVSITEYIRFISRISNKNFIFDENDLQFNVTIISEEPTTIEEIMAALMQELRIHGLGLIEQGNNLIIHTNSSVNSPANIVAAEMRKKLPPDAQLVTRVFVLDSFDPSRAADIIRPLLSNQAIIEPIDETNHLILTDLVVNVDKVAELLRSLDSPTSGLTVGQFQARNVFADALAVLAEKIITPLADGKTIQFVPFRETNMIYVISTDTFVKKSLEVLKQIDKGAEEEASELSSIFDRLRGREEEFEGEDDDEKGPRSSDSLLGRSLLAGSPDSTLGSSKQGGALWTEGLPLGHILSTEFAIYKLEFRRGEEIQEALQRVADSMLAIQGEGPHETELLQAISSVQWVETSNTLVFSGTKSAIAKLKNLIVELDTPNQQVLIEMLLLETTINDMLSYGVNFGTRFGDCDLGGSQALLTEGSPLVQTLNGVPGSTILDASNMATTAGFNLGIIGRNITRGGLGFSSLGALITAVHDDIDTKVVLNPKILVEDNRTAEVFAGLNVPFQTDSIANDFGTIITSNFEYRDIGARLTVTPSINVNGIISLEIEQELSTLVSSDATVISESIFDVPTGAGPTTRKSTTSTTVFVPNNYFVILSGVIQDEQERKRTNIPCLGGVPVLGAAFSQKDNRGSKRVLMIFIRPTLMNTPEEIRDMTKREQDIWEQKSEPKNNWEYEVNEALDFLNIQKLGCP